MIHPEKTKKYSADKIAFLGLFIVSLLIARVIIATKSKISMSEPIHLKNTGLSISLPTGRGWESEKQWRHEKNIFTVESFFYTSSRQPTVMAQCQYHLAAQTGQTDKKFEHKASVYDAQILDKGQIQSHSILINWAHIKTPDALAGMFFGTAEIGNGRQLDIEVTQTDGDTKFAWQVFKLLAENLTFQDNQLLNAGSEIVKDIKYTGLDYYFRDQTRETFFLILDARKRPIGFMMDLIVNSEDIEPGGIEVVSFTYLRGRYAYEQIAFFKGDVTLEKFDWKSETVSASGSKGSELSYDQEGIMTVKAAGKKSKPDDYYVSSAAVPDIFLDLVFTQFLNSKYEKILIDVVKANGEIIPTLISKDDTDNRQGYVLNVEYAANKNISEKVYFDNQMLLTRRIRPRENISIERVEAEEVLKRFPERAKYILRKNKVLGQDQI